MPKKKSVKKNSSPKKTVKTVTTTIEHKETKTRKKNKKLVSKGLELDLAKNIVELQKVHTNLAEKFEKLSDQLSTLLNLFESTAKTFSEHPEMKASEKDRKFLDKIDKLLDQNKTIAKGLTLMDERVRGKMVNEEAHQQAQPHQEQFKPGLGNRRPLPKF